MVFSSVSFVLRPYTIQPSMLVTFSEAFCPNQDRYELWQKTHVFRLKINQAFPDRAYLVTSQFLPIS